MDGFHSLWNYLAKCLTILALNQTFQYASGTASHLLKRETVQPTHKSYNLVSEAFFFRLQWSEFLSWWNKSNQVSANGEIIEEKIDNLTKAVNSAPLDEPKEAIKPLAKQLESFKVEGRKGSNIFAFWDEYLEMLRLMRSFIRAERTGDWTPHLNATSGMVPYFFAMDRMNNLFICLICFHYQKFILKLMKNS